jgi:uncharacterized YccA/Bax inhibitor family protein
LSANTLFESEPIMRTSNPTLSEDVFTNSAVFGGSRTMSLEGTAIKTGFLLMILMAGVIYTWVQTGAVAPAVTTEMAVRAGGVAIPQNVWQFMMVGGLGGFIAGIITSFVPRWSPFTAPVYAALEGMFIGAISSMFEYRYPGIAVQSAGLTFGTLAAMLLAYTSRLVRPTEQFKMGLVAATGAICMVYFASMILSFFGIHIPYIHQSGPIGIGFSLVVVVIAALNLVLDFEFIETGVAHGAPKYMEWYGGFGLLTTLVWFYVEVLRLLSKLRDRN